MKIKAISLWQPWASLIAVGAKRYETRSWKTDYRGPLLICAAKKIIKLPLIGSWDFRRAARESLNIESGKSFLHGIPYGVALAIVDLTDCYRTRRFRANFKDDDPELLFGDFSPGRYAWKLENVRAIDPFPVKGRQRIFDVEIENPLIKLRTYDKDSL